MIKGNRTTNIALILLLVIIWFFVIKKAFFQTKPDLNIEQSFVDNQVAQKAETLEKKTIALSDLKNPFLNAVKVSRKAVTTRSRTQSKPIKPKKTLSWPNLSYYGYVGENEGKNLQALIKLDSKLVRMKIGDQFQNIKLKKLYADSIVISLGNDHRTVKRGE